MGQRVRVWWAGSKAWYEGRVDGFDATSGRHAIAYDDGERQAHHLAKLQWERLQAAGCGLQAAGCGLQAAAERPQPSAAACDASCGEAHGKVLGGAMGAMGAGGTAGAVGAAGGGTREGGGRGSGRSRTPPERLLPTTDPRTVPPWRKKELAKEAQEAKEAKEAEEAQQAQQAQQARGLREVRNMARASPPTEPPPPEPPRKRAKVESPADPPSEPPLEPPRPQGFGQQAARKPKGGRKGPKRR